jgi:hypothetical protein
MDLDERVAAAVRNYEGLDPERILVDEQLGDAALASAYRLPYALGWIVGAEIVRARYRDSAIDAVPIFHPENGWDRFLLNRRVACRHFLLSPADEFGQLMLTGEDAPRLVQSGVDLPLGTLMRENPRQAIAEVLRHLPAVGLVEGDHALCWHERATRYPEIYDAVTELALQHPGLIPAREIYVDDEQINGTFHPLYLNGVVVIPQMTYDWFTIESGPWNVFFRVNGDQTLYDTGEGSWSTVLSQLNEDPDREAIARRIRRWLRLAGQPDPATID